MSDMEHLGFMHQHGEMISEPVVAMQLHASGSSPSQCQVLSGFFGYVVQGLLFLVCCGSLLLKWYLERPRRLFRIFFLDSSKQIFGAGVIHVLNMVCAILFSKIDGAMADECAWYWLNIMIDTTFGVLVCWALLKVTEKIFGYDSGHYGGKSAQTGIDWENSPDYRKWLTQIAVWGVIVVLMKLVVVVVMYAAAASWEKLAILCTHWIANHDHRLLFVMIVTPTVMNMFQFCVTDSFLKFAKKMKSDAPP